jgi:superfamily I DNA and/or RNA helicase
VGKKKSAAGEGRARLRGVLIAGDPKQLGPVIRSPLALELGLQVVLLLQILYRALYKVYDYMKYYMK